MMAPKIGAFGSSLKENERRVPIHPRHLREYPDGLIRRMVFETGYGARFGLEDDFFRRRGATTAAREALFGECDLLVLPKPMPQDLRQMRAGQVLFGWTHCVQQRAIAQNAIDRRLTLVSWENMHHWGTRDEKLVHVFYRNNEIAGYAAVLHCLGLVGIDGRYGPPRRTVILGYGSVSRGAVYALHALGFKDLRVYTRRPPYLVADRSPEGQYGQYYPGADGRLWARSAEGRKVPLVDVLAEADVICNGILQNPDQPVMFMRADEVDRLRAGAVVVDISCDEGMGFPFAVPTTFDDPMIRVGNNIAYYAVDHTPSHLWDAASGEISRALLAYLETVSGGRPAWDSNATVSRAIDILDGRVLNPLVLSFQRRRPEYPHETTNQ